MGTKNRPLRGLFHFIIVVPESLLFETEVRQMGVSLFRHNEEAFQAAAAMLQTEGKAAIIHPTGTGKSFIGFRLCEEHPDQTADEGRGAGSASAGMDRTR